jgi:hypothetical protein
VRRARPAVILEGMKRRAVVLALALASGAFSLVSRAQADDAAFDEIPPPPSPPRRGGLPSNRDLGVFDFEAFATRLSVPTLAVASDATPRRLVGVPAGSAFADLVGAGAGIRVRANGFVFPILGVRYAQSAGGAHDSFALANREAVTVRRGDVHVLQIDLPFLVPITGFQVINGGKDASWKFGAAMIWGASHTWTDVTLFDATNTKFGGGASAWSASARVDVSVCTRLEDASRAEKLVPWACLSVAPMLFDTLAGIFPGTSAGLRIDL